MNRTLDNQGQEFIKSFEDLELKAYKADASEPFYTIGYGHYGVDVIAGMEITEKQADKIFLEDIAYFEKGVNNILKLHKINDITQNQFNALVSFAFNVGLNSLQNSTLIKKLAKGDIQGASQEFLRWNKCNGKELKGLTRRRQEESKMFLG